MYNASNQEELLPKHKLKLLQLKTSCHHEDNSTPSGGGGPERKKSKLNDAYMEPIQPRSQGQPKPSSKSEKLYEDFVNSTGQARHVDALSSGNNNAISRGTIQNDHENGLNSHSRPTPTSSPEVKITGIVLKGDKILQMTLSDDDNDI